jgi:hypothetical protein
VTIPPPCQNIGPQCRSLKVTLRVGSLEDGPESLDHEATWLLGHTERIQFGEVWNNGDDLYVEAVIHVPCRFYQSGSGTASCSMYGYRAPASPPPRRRSQPRQLGGDRFQIVSNRRLADKTLRYPARSLPVLNGHNPCATAHCRTADNTQQAACCRDLEIEIMCDESNIRLASLVHYRRSPYLCKVERAGAFSLSAELISACAYLGEDGVACSLHGRERGDHRPAKPDLCSEWPHEGKGLHPGCVFKRR